MTVNIEREFDHDEGREKIDGGWVCLVIYRSSPNTIEEDGRAGNLSFKSIRPTRIAAVREVARQIAEHMPAPHPDADDLIKMAA